MLEFSGQSEISSSIGCFKRGEEMEQEVLGRGRRKERKKKKTKTTKMKR